MFHLYILYSKQKDKYYVGHTGDDVNERLRRHNSKHKGFTGSVADWTIVYTEQYSLKAEACKRESQIKEWKNRKMIEKLIGSDHPD